MIDPHKDKARLDALMPHIREYQKLATEHGINDIFQDNGGKLLQMLLVTGLKVLPGREGNDAVDTKGNEFELRSVNVALSTSFTTHHHLNNRILSKYRKVDWFFAVYRGIELEEIYFVPVRELEVLFAEWERRLRTEGISDLNNPKIPLKLVRRIGHQVYHATAVLPEQESLFNPPAVREAETGET